jgi:KaiC/GvpD/RAD55 family RecA-like ATPase
VGRTAVGFDAARRPGESGLEALKRLALGLRGGVLPVQGPPGAGKTYAGARMIVELVRAGRKVAVTAISHKAIANLLAEVVKAAAEANADRNVIERVVAPVRVRVGQKVRG